MTLILVCCAPCQAMFQPQLVSYSFNGVEAALLDVSSIYPERILMLDAYFYVVIFHGTTVAQWRKEGYHMKVSAFALFCRALISACKWECMLGYWQECSRFCTGDQPPANVMCSILPMSCAIYSWNWFFKRNAVVHTRDGL